MDGNDAEEMIMIVALDFTVKGCFSSPDVTVIVW